MLQSVRSATLSNPRNPVRETSAGSGRDEHLRDRIDTLPTREEIVRIVKMFRTKAYARFSMHLLASMKLLLRWIWLFSDQDEHGIPFPVYAFDFFKRFHKFVLFSLKSSYSNSPVYKVFLFLYFIYICI